MRIGELAQHSRIPASTIRYYEQIGLLSGVERTTGGSRRYTEEALHQLQIVRGLQSMGFSLTDMQVFFQKRGDFKDHQSVLGAIDTRLGELDSLINDLKAKKGALTQIRAILDENWNAGDCLNEDQIKQVTALVTVE